MIKSVCAALITMLVVAVPATAQDGLTEMPVTLIALGGPAASPDAEFSGLAWAGDTLLLLAENPQIYASEGNAGMIFALDEADLFAYLADDAPEPLVPTPIPIHAPDIVQTIPDFDGFEAIAVQGSRVFVLVEAIAPDGQSMIGYLVPGRLAPDLSALTLDLARRIAIAPQSALFNMGYESLLLTGDQVVAFYEINGAAVNAEPHGVAFDGAGREQGTIPFPPLEYRLTDVTPLDADGVFWGVNFFFPGEDFLLPERDPLVEQYGEGMTHRQYPQVERLVAFRYAGGAITLADVPPIPLVLPDAESRNWEGIARLEGRGFLLVTDRYPSTLLGFVPLPE